MSILSSWGKVFGKISEQIQGRIERLKNELATLEEERQELYGGSYSDKASKRILAINNRISVIQRVLQNNAKD